MDFFFIQYLTSNLKWNSQIQQCAVRLVTERDYTIFVFLVCIKKVTGTLHFLGRQLYSFSKKKDGRKKKNRSTPYDDAKEVANKMEIGRGGGSCRAQVLVLGVNTKPE